MSSSRSIPLKDLIRFMPYSALIGRSVVFCMSFTAVPILAVHGVTAALLTTALGVYAYKQRQDMYTCTKDYLKLLGICAASMIVTGVLSMLMHSLLAGIVITNLIPVVTGLISPIISPLCVRLFTQSLQRSWSRKFRILVSALLSCGIVTGLKYFFPATFSPATFLYNINIIGICMCSLFIAIYDVFKYIKGDDVDHPDMQNPDLLSSFTQSIGNSTVGIAANIGTVIAMSSLFPNLFPNAILVFSWQTPLVWAAIMTVSCIAQTLLDPVVAGTVSGIIKACKYCEESVNEAQKTQSNEAQKTQSNKAQNGFTLGSFIEEVMTAERVPVHELKHKELTLGL